MTKTNYCSDNWILFSHLNNSFCLTRILPVLLFPMLLWSELPELSEWNPIQYIVGSSVMTPIFVTKYLGCDRIRYLFSELTSVAHKTCRLHPWAFELLNSGSAIRETGDHFCLQTRMLFTLSSIKWKKSNEITDFAVNFEFTITWYVYTMFECDIFCKSPPGLKTLAVKL